MSPRRPGPPVPGALATLLLVLAVPVPAAAADVVRLQVFAGDRPPCTDAQGLPLGRCLDTRRLAAPVALGPGESIALGVPPDRWAPDRLLAPGPGPTVLAGDPPPMRSGTEAAWSLRLERPEAADAPPRIEVRLRDRHGTTRARTLHRWPEPGRWTVLLPGDGTDPGTALWLRRLPE